MNRFARILVVDDNDEIRRLLVVALEFEGYDVEQAAGGMEAFERIDQEPPDLVLLDITMPVISGIEVLEAIRRRSSSMPVILLTGMSAEENRVRGLKLGADDYVMKPFSTPELMARVEAVLRRSHAGVDPLEVINHAGLKLDSVSRELWIEGEPVELTAREFDLLLFFAARPGRVFTRHQLLRDVWRSSSTWQQASTVTEHVHRLRNKLGKRPDGTPWITTVRSVGYRFERRAGDS
jgi:two-component system phosphate regulon response regulator PhoB